MQFRLFLRRFCPTHVTKRFLCTSTHSTFSNMAHVNSAANALAGIIASPVRFRLVADDGSAAVFCAGKQSRRRLLTWRRERFCRPDNDSMMICGATSMYTKQGFHRSPHAFRTRSAVHIRVCIPPRVSFAHYYVPSPSAFTTSGSVSAVRVDDVYAGADLGDVTRGGSGHYSIRQRPGSVRTEETRTGPDNAECKLIRLDLIRFT